MDRKEKLVSNLDFTCITSKSYPCFKNNKVFTNAKKTNFTEDAMFLSVNTSVCAEAVCHMMHENCTLVLSCTLDSIYTRKTTSGDKIF